MKILLIGSGGREHALAWKIKESPKAEKLYCAPGNGGIKALGEAVSINPSDIELLLKFAKKNHIDLTVVGPEAPLVDGIVDRFNEEGLKIFGPTKDLALLEGSKVFSKETMKRFNIPTADFEVFDDPKKAKEYLNKISFPIVIKADGLCAGKGVVVAKDINEASIAIDDIMSKRAFGRSGDRIIIEECLEGEEASILIFSDGKNIVPLVSSQDHKRAFDNDLGPNTGGMGAYSPAPIVDKDLFDDIIKKVFIPLRDGFLKEKKIYKGVLYAGIMITPSGPKVLEFNVRFGDPEAQAILPRLKTDIVDIFTACIDGTLDEMDIEWDDRTCITVVLASKGYPAKYEKDKKITGLNYIDRSLMVFHAGTVYRESDYYTSGGRVLAVTAFGDDIIAARKNVYEEIPKISFDGMHYRSDIGYKAVKKIRSREENI